MGISGLNFYGKSFKGSRYIIRKNKKITRGQKNKKFTRGRKLTKMIKITKKDCTNDAYPKNKLYEYCPKSMGISGLNFYGRSFNRSRYITKGRKLPKMIKITKKDHTNDVYKTNKIIEYCPLCLIKLTPTQFTIHLTALIMKTICVCGVTIVIRPANCFYI